MERNWFYILKLVVCLIMTPMFSTQALAKDFGVVGHAYEIAEQDIIAYIKEKLAQTDLKEFEEKSKQLVKERVNRPTPVKELKKAKESREYFYDPTFVLDKAIHDHNGVLIHAEGTRINPLERVRLSSKFIFIDGDDEQQVELALKEYSANKQRARIILVNGSPIELQKKHKIWMYFDQSGILSNKLGIQHVPAIVSQDKLRLKVNEVDL